MVVTLSPGLGQKWEPDIPEAPGAGVLPSRAVPPPRGGPALSPGTVGIPGPPPGSPRPAFRDFIPHLHSECLNTSRVQVPPSLGHSTVRAVSLSSVSCYLGSSGSSPSHRAPYLLLFPWRHHSPEGEALCRSCLLGWSTYLLNQEEIPGEMGGCRVDLLVAEVAVSSSPLGGLRQFLDPVVLASWSVETQKSIYFLSWPGGVWACVCLADPHGCCRSWWDVVCVLGQRLSLGDPPSCTSFLMAATQMLGPLSVSSHWDYPLRAPGHTAPTACLRFLGLSGRLHGGCP